MGGVPPVSLDEEGHLLEGEEADAKGQGDFFQPDIRVQEEIAVVDEEVEVFKIKQQAQIPQDAADEKPPAEAPAADPAEQEAEGIIPRKAHQQDPQVAHIIIAVEPERHPDEECLGPGRILQLLEQKPPQKRQRKERRNEYHRVKKHLIPPSANNRSCPERNWGCNRGRPPPAPSSTFPGTEPIPDCSAPPALRYRPGLWRRIHSGTAPRRG